MNNDDTLNDVLKAFKIKAHCTAHKQVRNISLYDIQLDIGTKAKDIQKIADEISLILKTKSKPRVKIISEYGIVRLEATDSSPYKISYFDEVKKINHEGILPIYAGSTVDGDEMCFDIAKNPHTIIAGCTGSGKSTLLHIIMANLLRNKNADIRIIDTKNVEFGIYKKYENVAVTTNYKEAVHSLNFIKNEMDYRYNLMAQKLLPTNAFNEKNNYFKPIIFIIDEFADLVMQDNNGEFRTLLCKVAQKSRAAGIFCIVATQRPSVDVISGSIKANFPARISCQVASHNDSKVVLDAVGAELLVGLGDAIIKNYKYNYQRFQTAYTTPEEICQKCN